MSDLREPLRILIVDDCPDNRRALRLLLRVWGHEVAEAADGPEALDQAAAFRPEVVLLDLRLPGLHGFEVAARMRQRAPELCLVALSGCGQPGDVYNALEAGFDHYLVKPCDPRQLHSLLRSLVYSNRCAASS